MKALRALTHHHQRLAPSSASSSNSSPTTLVASSISSTTTLTPKPHAPPLTPLSRSIVSRHLCDNEPPLRAASFSAFANDELAAEHGYADHDATYFTLVILPPFTLDRIRNLVRAMVPELEPFEEQTCTVLSPFGDEGVGAAAKVVRIRGSVRGWWTVLQNFLDDEEGGLCYLKRVEVQMLMKDGAQWEGDGYEATRHFPEREWRT